MNELAIQRKRIAEEERKKRIFNDKYRLIGVSDLLLVFNVHTHLLSRRNPLLFSLLAQKFKE